MERYGTIWFWRCVCVATMCCYIGATMWRCQLLAAGDALELFDIDLGQRLWCLRPHGQVKTRASEERTRYYREPAHHQSDIPIA